MADRSQRPFEHHAIQTFLHADDIRTMMMQKSFHSVRSFPTAVSFNNLSLPD
jgi:hypothetical protein